MSDINKLLKNFTSSAIGNILGQLVNFFTLMYLPRVLGPEGYGIFNFAQSYVMYFLLLCDLGLSLYCVRRVNQSNDKEIAIKKIYNLKFYLSIISTILFFVTILLINKSPAEKKALYCIGISIFFTGITVDYLFNAFSNMKYIGMSTAFKNVLFCILCLAFVKNSNHVYLVSVFYTISVGGAMLFLLNKFNKVYFKLKVKKPKIGDFNLLERTLPLAVSLIMVQINNNFDIIYLSFIKTQQEVGYYSAPYKIINFLIAILCIYFNAAYPTIAELYKKNKSDLSKYITKFYSIGITFVMPIVFGGLALNGQIIDLLFGEQYQQSKILFSLLIPLILIRMITSTYGAVFIMGEGSKYFSRGVIIGATINIILNIILVPKYGAKGSAIATLVCESLQGVYLYWKFKVYCDSNLLKATIIPLITSIFMYILLINIFRLNVIICICVGVVAYFGLLFLIKFFMSKIKR